MARIFPAGRCKIVRMPNIFLVGFMGSGKSTVVNELATALGLRAVDLDVRVSEHEEMTIPEIFAARGESGFRAAETTALEGACAEQGVVVALGGGTFCSSENRRLIERAQGVSVFLDLPWSVLKSRLPDNDPDRPVFTSYHDAKNLFELRRTDYERAGLVLDLSGGESAADIAAMIRSYVSELLCVI